MAFLSPSSTETFDSVEVLGCLAFNLRYIAGVILRFERQEYWEWIQFALHWLGHPLQERFKNLEAHRILVSRDELDLIIEAVTECRDDWKLDLEDEDLTKRDQEGLRHDLVMLQETVDFLNELLLTK